MENNKLTVLQRIKKTKGIEYVAIAIIALVIVFILLSDGIIAKSNSKTTTSSSYVSTLEKRIADTLSEVKGAGKVSVAVTVEGGNTTVIANDKSTIKNGNEVTITETPVLVGGKIVVLGEKHPEITGVLVVSQGADNLSVRLNLLSAVTTLLSIGDDKVEIITGK